MTETFANVPSLLPGVCVIVPVFNREELIGYALQSLLAQTGVDLEVLVADDGSTDGTARFVASLADNDPRIQLLRCNHGGPAAARNVCMRRAKREFVTFLDSDDLCAPGRLSRQISKLIAAPEVDVVIGHRIHFLHRPGEMYPEPSQIVNRNIDICFASAMFRRDLFDELGGFDETLDYDDLDFYFRLLEQDRVFLIEVEPAVYHRRHGGNMTNDARRLQRGLLKAQHNSIVRRRAEGRECPLDVFFFRNFATETLWAGRNASRAPQGLNGIEAHETNL
jgi:glycosyltransferase involved in cell wall biosynthesis